MLILADKEVATAHGKENNAYQYQYLLALLVKKNISTKVALFRAATARIACN